MAGSSAVDVGGGGGGSGGGAVLSPVSTPFVASLLPMMILVSFLLLLFERQTERLVLDRFND
jgi:hypothetical protein